MGSFLSAIDMQSGSPSFGGPESVFGLYASGQIARRYGLPWRAGGGTLTASQSVDAQAAYESLNTLLAAFMAGANVVYQSAGWLESGLVACYEKFVLDIELLQMLRRQFTPVTFDEESLAFSAHAEIGPGGYFLGAEHTLERFRECFWRPALASTENFERWKRNGSLDARARAEKLWRADLERYEQPRAGRCDPRGTERVRGSAGRASSVTSPSRFPAPPRTVAGGLVAVAIMDASCSLKASTTSRRSRAMRRATSISTLASSVCGSSRRRSTRTIRASTTCSTPTSSAAPGADLTFFEYPGAIPGRPGPGMVHRIVTRVASSEALDFWEERLGGEGVATERAGDSLSFADPEGMQHELVVVDRPDPPLVARHREIPPELALQGFEAVRASSMRPDATRRSSRRGSASRPPATPSGRRAARPAAGCTRSTRRPRAAVYRAPAPFTTWPSPRPTRITRAGASACAHSASTRRR